jgi:peptide/nickel transport system permease protein
MTKIDQEIKLNSPNRATFAKHFFQNKLALFGSIVLLILFLMGIFAPVIGQGYDAVNISSRFAPPSFAHPFGTDHFGRDLLARIAYGARTSLLVSAASVFLALIIGVPLGVISGYLGHWVDVILMRAMDALMAFPGLVLALFLRFILGPGLVSLILTITFVGVAIFARTARGSVLQEKEKEYVVSALAIGRTVFGILFRHILPNILAVIIVLATAFLANAIVIEASLSFLGIGAPPTQPSWGTILGDSQRYMQTHAYIAIFPGVMIFLAVLGVNLLGDGLRDIFDPSNR